MTEQLVPPTFNVICSGQPRPGFESAAVAAALLQLKMAPAQVEQLLGGRRLLVKRGVGIDIANSYRDRLWAEGLDVAVAPSNPQPSAPQPSTTAPSAAVAAAPEAATADSADTSAVPSQPTPSPIPATPAPRTAPLSAAARSADRRLAAHWLLAAIVTLAMPAALITLLAAAVALLLHHAIAHVVWLQVPPWWWNGLLYLLPLLLGAGVVALLLRPLLPKPRAAQPIPFGRDRAPALWQLLDTVAADSGLPTPAGLVTTAGGEARATLAPGRAGWQRGETVLTLGLALLQQPDALRRATLAAALVETLPKAARLRRLVDGIERWLAANGEGGDRWQQWLQTHETNGAPRWLAPLLQLEQRYQQLSAKLFRRLLAHCQALTLPARRAQLLESDRAAATQIGSAGFAEWRRNQRCWQWAAEWAQPFALEHPVENLPALIGHAAQQPPAELLAMLQRELAATPTPGAPWPDERARADRIARLALPGLPVSEELVLDLGEQEIATTAAYYRALDIEVSEPLPTEQTEQLVALLREREQAATHYFNGWLHPERGWRLPDAALLDALPLNDATEQLHVCVNEIRRLTPDRARLLTSRERLQQQLAELRLGMELLSLRQPFTFRTPGIEPAALPGLIAAKQAEIDKLDEQLALQESIMGGRLALGLRLSGQSGDEVATLRAGLAFFHELLERIARLHGDAELLAGLQQRPLDAAARPVLARLRERVTETSERLLRRLEQAPPFPEQHVESFARRARRRLPAADAVDIATRALALCSACRDFHVELSKLAAEWASGSEESYAIETIRRIDLA